MPTTVTTIYALDMPKYIYVQLAANNHGGDTPLPLKIRADKIEKTEKNQMILKLGNETIGEFAGHLVVGWWIENVEV